MIRRLTDEQLIERAIDAQIPSIRSILRKAIEEALQRDRRITRRPPAVILDSTKLADLPLSARAKTVIEHAIYRRTPIAPAQMTLGIFRKLQITPGELKNVANCGRKTLAEIVEWMRLEETP